MLFDRQRTATNVSTINHGSNDDSKPAGADYRRSLRYACPLRLPANATDDALAAHGRAAHVSSRRPHAGVMGICKLRQREPSIHGTSKCTRKCTRHSPLPSGRHRHGRLRHTSQLLNQWQVVVSWALFGPHLFSHHPTPPIITIYLSLLLLSCFHTLHSRTASVKRFPEGRGGKRGWCQQRLTQAFIQEGMKESAFSSKQHSRPYCITSYEPYYILTHFSFLFLISAAAEETSNSH